MLMFEISVVGTLIVVEIGEGVDIAGSLGMRVTAQSAKFWQRFLVFDSIGRFFHADDVVERRRRNLPATRQVEQNGSSSISA